MKILTAEQLSEADKYTIKKNNITSEELMEKAAVLVFNEIHKRLQGAPIPIKIFCGVGNNGGDGLVVARHLIQHGYHVTTFIVNYSDKRSKDFLSNYERIKEITKDWPLLIEDENNFPELNPGDFIIDAIFGIGLNRPIKGWMSKLITVINDSQAFTLSIDMPSGLFADQFPGSESKIIEADFTLSFQAPKISFFMPETMDFVGDFQVLDIGLDREYIAGLGSQVFLMNKPLVQSLYKHRKKNSHKGNYGHVLITGGSYGKIGSVLLTATAALKSGSGLCTVYTPKCGYEIIQTALPEAMVITDPELKLLSDGPEKFDQDASCFGMGVGVGKKQRDALYVHLEAARSPVLIDADGLNILAENKNMLGLLPENSILTPHPGELKRLLGDWNDDFDKLEKLKEFSKKYNVIVVLKGAYTFTVFKNEVYINSSGNPGMATAGSGDVLSGVITSLLGQRYSPISAAVLGVYLHGLAGDIVSSKLGYESVTAGAIAQHIGRAVQELFRSETNESAK